MTMDDRLLSHNKRNVCACVCARACSRVCACERACGGHGNKRLLFKSEMSKTSQDSVLISVTELLNAIYKRPMKGLQCVASIFFFSMNEPGCLPVRK